MEARLSRRVVEVAPGISRVAPRRSVAQALLLGAEPVVLVALLALAVVARRPHYLLTHSFWLDEGWVVDSVRAPIGQLRLLTSSTPIGWTLLLRAVPPLGGPERYRLLPLAFGVATVPLAWMLARRLGRWGTVRAAAVAVGSLHLLVYLAIAGAGDNPAMRRWWLPDYIHLDNGLGPAARFVGDRVVAMLTTVGLGPWWLVLALVAVGVWSLARAGRPAAALLLPLLALELVIAAAAQRYPFLEVRTSLFVAVTVAVYAALGVAELVAVLLARGWTVPLAVGVAAGAAVLLVPAAADAARQKMPSANVREQIAVVRAHWRPGDALVVNSAGTFPFAYYWPDQPTFVHTNQSTAVNFMVTYPDHPELVMVNGSRLGVAPAMARAHAAGDRIWVIFAHGAPSTVRRWSAEAARYGHIEHPGPKALPLLVQPAR